MAHSKRANIEIDKNINVNANAHCHTYINKHLHLSKMTIVNNEEKYNVREFDLRRNEKEKQKPYAKWKSGTQRHEC